MDYLPGKCQVSEDSCQTLLIAVVYIGIYIDRNLLLTDNCKAVGLGSRCLGHSCRSRGWNRLTLDNTMGLINFGSKVPRIGENFAYPEIFRSRWDAFLVDMVFQTKNML